MGKKRNIHIEHPEAWELLVAIGDERVDYILYTPSVANSLIIGDVAWTDDTLQGLEDAIYDTPVLLDEYKRVRVIVDSSHYVFLPDDTSDADCVELVRHAFRDDEGDAAVCALPGNGVKLAWLMPRGMQAFLGRTFNYPMICHHLFPLCEYIVGQDHSDARSRMSLNLKDGGMDLAVYREGKLQCANTFQFTNFPDATYYAMSMWRSYGMDQLTDELQLMGDREACAAMTPKLREFVKYVMPAEYPAAAMRLGRNAMQAPLELILLALCE